MIGIRRNQQLFASGNIACGKDEMFAAIELMGDHCIWQFIVG